ncbi:collagen alpha-5(vi) chain [Plakobranchus ocellatus]|uniref:Collagen alpha-5(Vi) chain n=1 Tax=Plakobranchus ocellatus TaxID=259542 RepID=A0AAV4DJJ6_9GAST|nr:collagen alpha-5(vi) chain [Plakobranchus ocellatus]
MSFRDFCEYYGYLSLRPKSVADAYTECKRLAPAWNWTYIPVSSLGVLRDEGHPLGKNMNSVSLFGKLVTFAAIYRGLSWD